jgi:ubiquinone/menaquinone biosynthesis C-methylase UbiE
MDTGRTWEQYGRDDPYYGVLSQDRYRRENLSDAALQDFFASGEVHVQRTLSECERYFGVHLPRAKSLDFGCGVGRLTFPLARRFEQVVGVDVSSAMIAAADQRAQVLQLRNVRFCRSLEELAHENGMFSFVNSYIVLQHVDPARGIAYVAAMLRLLDERGFGAIHVTYGRKKDWKNHGVRSPGSRVAQLIGRPIAQWGRRLRRAEPKMQMNPYPLNKLAFLLQSSRARSVRASFSDHGGDLGMLLLFARA